MSLKAPFLWFGGKSRVAHIVWERFGDVPNYVEPFFGSGAVLLGRPTEPRTESVNDKDAYLANFWRAIQHDQEQVAYHADWPVSEADLLARHRWLCTYGAARLELLRTDPEFFDAKIAGWWVWGLCSWVGSGWCVNVESEKLPHLGDAGMGINRKSLDTLQGYFTALSDRFRTVRVCCGEWDRVLGESVTIKHGITGIFLDPPYSHDERDDRCYSTESDCSSAVRQWAIANGDNPLLRIALCGYEGEHEMPATWETVQWKAPGGYGSQAEGRGRDNRSRERIWFSPHCIHNELFK